MKRLSVRWLKWLCAAALIISLLPLYAAAFNAHASYDDLGFSLKTHQAWRDSGSLWETLKAAGRNTAAIRYTWEGTYATSFIAALQPALFGEALYGLTTLWLLTFFLLALGFFLWVALRGLLGVDRDGFWVIFCLLAMAAVQFVPDVSEAFFWFNGGTAYTLMWSLALVRLALWLCLDRAKGGAAAALYGLLAVLTVIIGGAKYSTVLPACLADVLLVGYAFWRKRPYPWAKALLLGLLLGCFAFSAAAPGNAVRAATLNGGMSAFKAVAQAVYFGLGLMGAWCSLPLIAVWGLSGCLLAPRLKGRSCAHPLMVTLLAAGLFCAQLTPTLITGNYLGDGRTVDTYYYTYVLMGGGLTAYWLGWALNRREGAGLPGLTQAALPAWALIAAAALIVVGCVGYHPEGTESYGPQNTASGMAARALISGQAGRYDWQMDQRDAAMNDPGQPSVVMRPAQDIPAIFMGEALDTPMRDYVLSLYQEYYQKQSVTLAPREE